MATFSKEIADKIVAGGFKEDGWVKIVEYDNAWGGVSYGAIAERHDPDTYAESEFVRNPRVYWERAK